MDFGCHQTVSKVEGRDAFVLRYAVQYFNNDKIWETVTSKDETYDNTFKVGITSKVISHATHRLVPRSTPLHLVGEQA